MSSDEFTLPWFIIFAVVMLIAFLANMIIILAILKDKSMHTSTYYYIINVNVADILLVLSCLPERLTETFGWNDVFHLGMFTCYLLPFLQQVAMHAALAFLLVLTVHRCYPAGVPRFLQGDLIRRQIRHHAQTLCILWSFAILVNLPLFTITKYEANIVNITIITENDSTFMYTIPSPTCFTGATKIWSRAYLILLLVLTYLITGIFLIVIYGQAIRIILASKRYSKFNSLGTPSNKSDAYRYLTASKVQEQQHAQLIVAANDKGGKRGSRTLSSTSSSTTTSSSNRRNQPTIPRGMSLVVDTPIENGDLRRPSTNCHSTQHTQVIVMLFIVIVLYILLLLPYRLLNLLFIVHNTMFQHGFMNEVLFHCLLNTVRLLVFLNCALQPITCLIISSRLRQTVIKFLRSLFQCSCHCRLSSLANHHQQNYRNDARAQRAFFSPQPQNITRFQHQPKLGHYHDNRPIQTSLNNLQLVCGPGAITKNSPQRISSGMTSLNSRQKSRVVLSFANGRSQK